MISLCWFDNSYSGLLGILLNTASLSVFLVATEAVIEILCSFYGVKIIDNFECLDNLELSPIPGGVKVIVLVYCHLDESLLFCILVHVS